MKSSLFLTLHESWNPKSDLLKLMKSGLCIPLHVNWNPKSYSQPLLFIHFPRGLFHYLYFKSSIESPTPILLHSTGLFTL